MCGGAVSRLCGLAEECAHASVFGTPRICLTSLRDGYWTARVNVFVRACFVCVFVCVRVEFPRLKRVCQQYQGWITWLQLHAVNPLFLFIPIACVTDLITGKAAAACRRFDQPGVRSSGSHIHNETRCSSSTSFLTGRGKEEAFSIEDTTEVILKKRLQSAHKKAQFRVLNFFIYFFK